MRTIVVGDVHGCLDALDELLARVSYRRGEDRLVLAGDLLDRGPDPVGVVRRARELSALAVLGNHDEKHLRWASHERKRRADPGYKNPMRKFSEEQRREHALLAPEDLEWLAALPLYLRLDARWVVVHAGCVPGFSIERQKANALLRLRRVDARNEFVPLPADGRFPGNTVPWATRWHGPESVIYGHEVHGLELPRIDEPVPGIFCYGIDTGCCFGGRLTALVLPSLERPSPEVVQVQARRAYSPITFSE